MPVRKFRDVSEMPEPWQERGPELLLAGEPDRLGGLQAVERPLGRAVEGQHLLTVRQPDVLDHHVADHEDLVVEVAVGYDEPVAVRG